MFRTLRKIKWEEIEVGTIFGFDGCFGIGYKISKDNFFILAHDMDHYWSMFGDSEGFTGDTYSISDWQCLFCDDDEKALYVLPKEVRDVFGWV